MTEPTPIRRCGAPVTRCTGCTNTVAATLDICPKCGGHDFEDSACRRQPMRDSARCDLHGGKSPAAKTKAASRKLEAEARRELARLGEAAPIGDPVEELLALAAERQTWLGFLRDRMAELDSLEAVDSFGVERARALVDLYAKALDGSQRALEGLVKLDLDVRRLRLDEAKLALVVTALERALTAPELALPAATQQAVYRRLQAELVAAEGVEVVG